MLLDKLMSFNDLFCMWYSKIFFYCFVFDCIYLLSSLPIFVNVKSTVTFLNT